RGPGGAFRDSVRLYLGLGSARMHDGAHVDLKARSEDLGHQYVVQTTSTTKTDHLRLGFTDAALGFVVERTEAHFPEPLGDGGFDGRMQEIRACLDLLAVGVVQSTVALMHDAVPGDVRE